MLLSELRALIMEAMDPMLLIVVDDDYCALITNDNDKERIRGGMKFEYSQAGDAWEVTQAWATDPRAAVALFGSCLVAKERLLPDSDLTPAAKAIIKRWYSRHKDDGSIEPGPKRQVYDTDPAFNSIYTVPAGFTSPVPIEPVRQHDDIKHFLRRSVRQGFHKAYEDLSKTGELNLDSFLKTKDWSGLQRALVKIFLDGQGDSKGAAAWVNKHADMLRQQHIPWRPQYSQWRDFTQHHKMPDDIWTAKTTQEP